MAQKVEGWVTPWGLDDAIRHGGEVVLRKNEIKPLGTIRATLIATDERVFTESEVRAMLDEMEEDIHEERYLQQFRNISRSHGISDPA